MARSGRVEKAIEQLTALLPNLQQIRGPDHADTLTIRSNLGHWLGIAGRVEEAIELFTGFAVRSHLAHWLGEVGRFAESIELLRELIADQQRILGPDHPDVLRTRSDLAHWLSQAGKVDEAIALFTGVLADQQRVLGAGHPDILATRTNLIYVEASQQPW